MEMGVRTSSTQSSGVPGQDDCPEEREETAEKGKHSPPKGFGDPLALEKAFFERPSPFSHPQGRLSTGHGLPRSPLTSSLAIRMVSVTSEKTVGLMKSPLSSMAEPPHSSLAPSFFPLSIRSRILSNCFWSICKTERGKLGFFLDGDFQLMCPTASCVVADLITF